MDVIIIGAGAAGLMAARELAKAKQKVIVLEARDRIGGRIHTINIQSYSINIEAGAEFIHGNLDVTLKLLKEAGIDYHETTGDFWQVLNGKWEKNETVEEGESLLMERLKNLKDNISIAEFLQREFPGDEHQNIKQWLLGYIEGYYSGDPARTSAMAFYNEWQTEDEQQYRPNECYGKMIQYLADQCTNAGGIIQTSTVVKQVRWYKDQVEVLDDTHHGYTARKVIIAVPLGVWNAGANEKGAISYIPELQEKMHAVKQMGFGAVIKILLQFKDAFWEDENIVKQQGAKDFSFILSDQPIGTWWSQLPNHSPVLTGWLAGPKATELKDTKNEMIRDNAINSIASILQVNTEFIKEKLLSWHVFNWTADPFTRGSYAYSTMETKEARKVLMQPTEETLFFAGDAFYDGPEMGTVEAALTSGKRVAKEVLNAINNKG